MLDDNMVCLDDGVKITVLDETSPDWALAKGGAQDTSADLKARTVDVPTTLQTSTRASATSTPDNLALNGTSSRIFRIQDITCFDKVAIIAKDRVKEAFIKHTCNSWDDKQLKLRGGHGQGAVKMEMLREGVKMYLYIGILPFNGDWVYALESTFCTSLLMRIIDKCTEVNLLVSFFPLMMLIAERIADWIVSLQKGGRWADDHIEYLINVLEVDSVMPPPTLT